MPNFYSFLVISRTSVGIQISCLTLWARGIGVRQSPDVGTWTAQNLLEAWQVKFGVLDPKWHQRFLADPLTLKILEFDIAEIQLCIDAPAGSVYSGWWYSEEEATGRKKLVYILRHLEYFGLLFL